MSEIRFDFKGIINLLAKNLYSEKKVFIRELLQNAHDAVRRRQERERRERGAGQAGPEGPKEPPKQAEHGSATAEASDAAPGGLAAGRIDIECHPQEDRIVFRDSGIGMSKSDLENYLASIGASGTRESEAAGVVGQFGIGFLSAFIVAKKVDVYTRKLARSQGWHWSNEGDQSYTLQAAEVAEPGTTVAVTLAEIGDRGLIREEYVKDVVRQYCDLLAVPIHVGGGEQPVNSMRMPWEQPGLDAAARAGACRTWLERTVHCPVLEAVPFELARDGVEARGVLFIPATRMASLDAPRTLRVFLKRMFLCENVPDLLPKWAGFVHAVVDTASLTPTAARDNFQRDAAADALRDALGQVVLEHLEGLQASDPAQLSRILALHDMPVKAACDFDEAFFGKFAHLLEWKVNSGPGFGGGDGAIQGGQDSLDGLDRQVRQDGRAGAPGQPFRRLPLAQILKLVQPGPGGLRRLPAFTSGHSANQYFHMANASGAIVVDASQLWDAKILGRLARRPDSGFELLFLGQEEDPVMFREVDTQEGQCEALRHLAEAVAQTLATEVEHLQVDVRHFQPAATAALLRGSPQARGRQRARQMAAGPKPSAAMQAMAGQMLRLAPKDGMRLTLNADNLFIQRLARQDLTRVEVKELMLGLHHNALLCHHDALPAETARTLHAHFAALMRRNLDLLEERAALQMSSAHYIPPQRLREIALGIAIHLTDQQATTLSEAWPTPQHWRGATHEAVAQKTGLRPGMAGDLVAEVLDKARDG